MTRTFEAENTNKTEEMVFTPFGPAPIQGKGYKMKGKTGNTKGYQFSSSDQNKSSSLLDLSLLSDSHAVSHSMNYSSVQNSVENDNSEYQFVAFQPHSLGNESVEQNQNQQQQILHQQQNYKEQQQQQYFQQQSQHYEQLNNCQTYQQQEQKLFHQQQQQNIHFDHQQSHQQTKSELQEKEEVVLHQQFQQKEYNQDHQQYIRQELSLKEETEKFETASSKSYNQSPFTFKRPTAFNKANGSFGSFGSQLNLASMKEENTVFKVKNIEEQQNTKNSIQQIYQSSEKNIQVSEEQSFQTEHQSFQESTQFSTSEISNNMSQEAEKYESSSYRLAQSFEESEIAGINEGLTFPNDISDERDHFNAVCRYEQSQKSNDDKDKCYDDIEKYDDLADDIEDKNEVKEYSVAAKIIVNPNTGENEVTTWDTHDSGQEIRDMVEKKTQDKSEFLDEIRSLGIVQQNFQLQEHSTQDLGKSRAHLLQLEEESIKQEQLFHDKENEDCDEDFERMEKSEIDICENKVEFFREEVEVKDYSDLFINEEQKTVINSCIEELEKSTDIDNKTKNIVDEKEYEDVNFKTEQILDNEDLEYVYVQNCKNEKRRLSFQHQIQTSDIIQICEQVDSLIEEQIVENCSTEKNIIESNMNLSMTETMEMKKDFVKNQVSEEHSARISTVEDHNIEKLQENVKNELSTFFLTETESDDDLRSKAMNKRQRNRTIDYHNLPSLYWEASVQNYHEKKFTEKITENVSESITEIVSHEVQTDDNEKDSNNIHLAKDGLSIILQKYVRSMNGKLKHF